MEYRLVGHYLVCKYRSQNIFKVIKIYEDGNEDLQEVFQVKEYDTHTLDLSHILSAEFDG